MISDYMRYVTCLYQTSRPVHVFTPQIPQGTQERLPTCPSKLAQKLHENIHRLWRKGGRPYTFSLSHSRHCIAVWHHRQVQAFEVLLGVVQGGFQGKTSSPRPPEQDRDRNPGLNEASRSQASKTGECHVAGLWKVLRIDH